MRIRVIGFLIVFALIGCGKKEKAQSVPPPSNPLSQVSPAAVDTTASPAFLDSMAVTPWTKAEQALFDNYYNGARLVAQRSSFADSLLAFFDSCAVKVKRLDDERLQSMNTATSPYWFFVGPTLEYRTSVDTSYAKGAMFIPNSRLMALYDNQFGSFVRGLFLLHETTHVYDHVILSEPNALPLSPIWLLGELHAHASVSLILNQYTEGKWNQIVQDCAAEHDSARAEQGADETAIVSGLSVQLEQRIRRLFPGLNHQDQLFMNTQLMIEANMTNLAGLASSPEEYQNLGLAFLAEFYGQADPTLFRANF